MLLILKYIIRLKLIFFMNLENVTPYRPLAKYSFLLNEYKKVTPNYLEFDLTLCIKTNMKAF